MSSQGLLPPRRPPDERTGARQVRGRLARWWARWRPAGLTGADLRILNQVSSEWNTYDSIGVAVFGLTCFSGFSATLAVGYALRTPALDLWWFGVIWTVGLMLCIERVILQVPTTRKKSTFYTSLLFRGALSILLALFLSEPMILRLNESDINRQLHFEHRQAKEHAEAEIASHYSPEIETARNEFHAGRTRKNELAQKVTKFRRLHNEAAEAGACGAACIAYGETATKKEGLLEAVEKRNSHRQDELHEKVRRFKHKQRNAENAEGSAVNTNDGFWARLGALSAVLDQRPLMKWELWGLRVGFLLFDLIPLIALILYLKRDGSKPYEELRVAYWGMDALLAKEMMGHTDVREHEIRERTKGEKEAVQAEIMLETDRRMAAAGLDGTVRGPEASHHDPTAPVTARNLSGFVDEMRSWENEPVTVSPALRRGGIIGSLVIGGLALLTTLWSVVTGHPVRGLWLVVAALCVVVVLALATHGFRRAPAWALWAIFTTLIVGLALPLLILGINL